MQARAREVDGDRRRIGGLHLIAVDPVQEGARRVRAIGVLVRQRRAIALVIPALAGSDTGIAADAGACSESDAGASVST